MSEPTINLIFHDEEEEEIKPPPKRVRKPKIVYKTCSMCSIEKIKHKDYYLKKFRKKC